MKSRFLIISILILAVAVSAATYVVSIGDNFFLPEVITISPGDRIRWTNDGELTHRSRSIDGLWNSGLLYPGESYTRTFNDEGSFDYNDPQHPAATGTIIVSTGDVEQTSWGMIRSLYR